MTKEEFKAKVSMAYGGRETWEEFLEAVWQLHLEASNNWIPVEEELPEMYERVLVAGLDKRSKLKEPLLFVTCRAKEECGIECDSNGFSVGDMPFAYKKVTHWMPLPAAPRKEE